MLLSTVHGLRVGSAAAACAAAGVVAVLQPRPPLGI